MRQLDAAFDAGALQFFGALLPLRDRRAFLQHLAPARHVAWVVYAKRPFAGPQQVLEYVGRYTHRVAISNSRVVDMEDGQVRFRYKDYREPHPDQKTMTLSAGEFIRRFLLHVLPTGFHRIRYYGLIGHRHRKDKLAVGSSSARRRPPLPRQAYRRTIATDTRRSPASRCGSVPSVMTVTCSSSNTWHAPAAPPRSPILHEPPHLGPPRESCTPAGATGRVCFQRHSDVDHHATTPPASLRG